jgi:hypothetical protein
MFDLAVLLRDQLKAHSDAAPAEELAVATDVLARCDGYRGKLSHQAPFAFATGLYLMEIAEGHFEGETLEETLLEGKLFEERSLACQERGEQRVVPLGEDRTVVVETVDVAEANIDFAGVALKGRLSVSVLSGPSFLHCGQRARLAQKIVFSFPCPGAQE